MKHLYFVSVLAISAALFMTQAWSQNEGEGIMILKSREFGQHEEQLVRFDHYLHENTFRCLVCHHDFRIYSNRNEGKGSKCSGCHKHEPSKEIPVPLLEAFHGSCIECHEKYMDWGRSSGPVGCDDCHLKQ